MRTISVKSTVTSVSESVEVLTHTAVTTTSGTPLSISREPKVEPVFGSHLREAARKLRGAPKTGH